MNDNRISQAAAHETPGGRLNMLADDPSLAAIVASNPATPASTLARLAHVLDDAWEEEAISNELWKIRHQFQPEASAYRALLGANR